MCLPADVDAVDSSQESTESVPVTGEQYVVEQINVTEMHAQLEAEEIQDKEAKSTKSGARKATTKRRQSVSRETQTTTSSTSEQQLGKNDAEDLVHTSNLFE